MLHLLLIASGNASAIVVVSAASVGILAQTSCFAAAGRPLGRGWGPSAGAFCRIFRRARGGVPRDGALWRDPEIPRGLGGAPRLHQGRRGKVLNYHQVHASRHALRESAGAGGRRLMLDVGADD